ncbi:MAG: flagellar basal body L-ring protein FlgH, partial [Gammaproteobacteria bacterium]|nr:flagellar basal body L-ring protein FlgH [Gammaproteobacteria bacterium]
NGNLLVRGQKWIAINQGREYVRIQGIVRPVDIRPDNTVPSTKVADATIAYGSQGALNDSNSKGWLARFFDSRWMPF